MANITREELTRCFPENTPEEEINKTWERILVVRAEEEAIEAAGLKVSYRKALVKVSNTRWHGGRLIDGTCHYRFEVTVTGNTYPVKDSLKSLGFRWHPGDRLWYRPMTDGSRSVADHLDIGRREVAEAVS